MIKSALLSVLLFMLSTVTALAQESPNPVEPDRPWLVRASFGSARIHDHDRRADWTEVRVGRTAFSRFTSIDVGISGSGSPGAYTSLTGGFEVRPLPQARISPFLRAEAGFLGESDFAGAVAGVGGGVILRLGSRIGVRAGAGLNGHGGAKGPVTFFGGLEYRW